MPGFTVLDYVFLSIIVVCGIVAFIKGFIQEVFGKIAWVVAVICAFLFNSKLAVVFEASIAGKILCKILAFVLIFIVVFVVIKVIGMVISKLCDFTVIRGLDRALGLFLGLAEGFAIVCLLTFILSVQTLVNTDAMLSKSFIYKKVKPFIEIPMEKFIQDNKESNDSQQKKNESDKKTDKTEQTEENKSVEKKNSGKINRKNQKENLNNV